MYDYLSQENIKKFIEYAYQEDIGSGDHSSLASIPSNAQKEARLLVKDNGIIAGVKMAEYILNYFNSDLLLDISIKDGTEVKKGDVVFRVKGDARDILGAERLLLNCMQRMSGIATYTAYLNRLIKDTNAQLLDTRKTTPNFRIAEKWAVKIGGGANHRFGLFDMVMLKDNHIDFAGGITEAIDATVNYLKENDLNLKIEVETRSLQEVEQVVKTGKADVIMLDNMPPEIIVEALRIIDGKFKTEASGGITEETIRSIAETGVDFISVGALTHSSPSLDMSLKAIND